MKITPVRKEGPVAELSGRQKAAVVLMTVDSQTAATVLKTFSDEELSAIAKEMNQLGDLEAATATAVLHEFSVRAVADKRISVTPSALRERLELAVGRDSTREILREVGLDDTAAQVFEPLQEMGSEDLYKLLADEHPQTTAVVLSNLHPRQTAATLGCFEPEAQADLIRRMAGTQHTDDAMLMKVGESLRSKTAGMRDHDRRRTPEEARYKKVAEVINLLGKEAEGRILEQLTGDSPEMVSKLKEMMFVFEDLVNISDVDMRKLLMAVDTQVLAMALKTASAELKEKIFSNLSKRAAEMVNEELELLGPKPLSQVKGAQQQIVESIRELEESGELNLSSATSEEDPLV